MRLNSARLLLFICRGSQLKTERQMVLYVWLVFLLVGQQNVVVC